MKHFEKKKLSIILFSILLLNVIFGTAILNKPYYTPINYGNVELRENLNPADNSGGGYTMNTDAVYNWEEISTTGTRLAISDSNWTYEDISFITAGWNFTFYETEYNKISVSTNGWLSFPNLGWTGGILYNIPSVQQENIDCVALLARIIYPSLGGDIYYEFLSSPNRLVIEYYQIYDYNYQVIGDFEVIFFEDGIIKFQYKNVMNYREYNAIGLDHGELTNFNSYNPTVQLSSKAIEFTFNEMVEINYTIGVKTNDEYSWITTTLNNDKMEDYFGSNWEETFGLPQDPSRATKTKINITSIVDNSTHWTINYDTWDWTYRLDNFSSTPGGSSSLEYQKEPMNYTVPHYLDKMFPLILPNKNILYLSRANLVGNYYFWYDQYGDMTYLHYSDSKNVGGDYINIDVEARYNSKGLLVFLNFNWYNQTDGTHEKIFQMETLTANHLTSFSLGVEIDDEYTWIAISINDLKMESFFGSNWENTFGLFPDPTRGTKTKINITSIVDNSTHWTINYDTWDWTYKLDNFSSTPGGSSSLEYQKEPMNYSYPNFLPNIFPLITPIPPTPYFQYANLDTTHYYIDEYYTDKARIRYNGQKEINGHWITLEGYAMYNSDGFLEYLKFRWVNQTTWESEYIFKLETMTSEYLTSFTLDIQENDEYTWITTKLNDQKMEAFYEPNWENTFGLFPDPTRGTKTKINITSIVDNSTHWTINYDTWDWTYRLDNFSSTPGGSSSLEYQKEPMNYSYPNFLPNFFPLITPIPPNLYFKFANLESHYQFWYNEYDNTTSIDYSDSKDLGGDYIQMEIRAQYDSKGLLIFLKFDWYNQTDGTRERVFEISNYTLKYSMEYALGVETNEELLWLLTNVDDSLMQTYFGPNWESMFGLPSDPLEMSKMKINITSIQDNSTHWKINYDVWDWVDIKNNFNPLAENTDSLEYLQEPFNYTTTHNLPNIFPLIVPNPPAYYLDLANLDSAYYSSIYPDYNDPKSVVINYYFSVGYMEVLHGTAKYDEFGILSQLSFMIYIHSDGTSKSMLNILNFYDGPKTSFIGFNEGDIYEYGYYNCSKNAPEGIFYPYFPPDTKRIRSEILFVGGEDPKTEKALVLLNISVLDTTDEWHPYSGYVGPYYYTPAIFIYRNATTYEQMNTLSYSLFLITGNDVDWERFCNDTNSSYPPGYNITFSPLPNGFTVVQEEYYYLNGTLEYYFNYTSSGVLDLWIMRYDGKEFMSLRLNDFDYVIPECDIFPPIITIISPESNEVFGNSAAEFIIEIDEIYLNTTWYTISGLSDIFIFTDNGSIDQTIWDNLSDGNYTITFYANDTAGNIGFTSVTVEKDTTAPEITITSPGDNQEFSATAPPFDLSIVEGNLDTIWYTLDKGITNITCEESGQIDQTIWDSLSDGTYTITFYANDTAGNIGSSDVTIIKASLITPEISGFTLLTLIGISIGIISIIRKKIKVKIH